MRGAVTYDLVSLLKDCYIAWPRASACIAGLCSTASSCSRAGFALDADERTFIRWFDLMGLQRHIKVLGIFARLYYRDGKTGYLKDLPRVLAYAREHGVGLSRDGGSSPTSSRRIEPAFPAAQARVGAAMSAAAPSDRARR